jgi:formylglycine-generating enzyme required for sulfatase activity
LTFLLISLLGLSVSTLCFAAGYHVYDWKGPAKEKKGKEIRESKWQPGYVLLKDSERLVGKIRVTAIDGRIAEVEVNPDGKRKKTYSTKELKSFGLILSVADIENDRGEPTVKFGPGTLELSDGRLLEGILGAASLKNGVVYSISYAPDRNENLTSYFSHNVNRAEINIDGIPMEYLAGKDGFSKIPTLAEYRTIHHEDVSRNPHKGSLVLANGEVSEGELLLVKDEDNGPAIGAMIFYEDGYGTFWSASELERVMQVVGSQTHYWHSYGARLEQLPTLKEYNAKNYRDKSRNANPGELVMRNGRILDGSVAFVKTKDDVNSIEIFYFDNEGTPYSYNGSDVMELTQTIENRTHHYIPYQDIVFVELLARGDPYQIHANPFPEREDQFKKAVTRGLLSVLSQVAANQIGQPELGNAISFGSTSCETTGSCFSRNTLRFGVEEMVPDFKKDEFVFRRANGQEVVLFKKTYDKEIEPLLERCPAYSGLSRREKKDILDFDDPGQTVSFLNDCPDATADQQAGRDSHAADPEPGTLFQDDLNNIGKGPSMVVVPPGSYMMGDETGTRQNEVPRHRVYIERPFAVSQHEITLGEFELFTSSTGRVKRTGQLSKKAGSPVRGVAWIDAVAYTQWLSALTGHDYRLPTEAEWEYVARAGSTTSYPWGDSISADYVACEACGDKKQKLEDTGQFPPNEFGLFDVSGNVWEWVADCWHPEYSGAPTDSGAWMSPGDCNLRMLRGGSAKSTADQLRTSFRTASNPIQRGELVGFRVVRDL